jgi:hypothetical protein
MRQVDANLGYPGMPSVKAFGILVEPKGEGWASAPRSGNPVIGTSGDRRRKPLNPTPNSPPRAPNLRQSGMSWDEPGGGGVEGLNAERDPGPEIGSTD